MEMRNLSAVVESVKTSKDPGKPLSESFKEAVVRGDRTRCIAEIALDDLWNGESSAGWVAPSTFMDMVVYTWRNAPSFFVEEDLGREINESPLGWNQEYLDVQRNFLRHNFSIRRLCHLVMVYEYLHGDKARVSREVIQRPLQSVASQSCGTTNPTRIGHSSWRGALAIIPGILLFGASMYLLGRYDSGCREVSTTSEFDRQRAEPGAAGTRYVHAAHGVASENEMTGDTQRPQVSKNAAHSKKQMDPQTAQDTNTAVHSLGPMKQQAMYDTNSLPRLSGQGKPRMPQGACSGAILVEQEVSGERASVKRTKGSGL